MAATGIALRLMPAGQARTFGTWEAADPASAAFAIRDGSRAERYLAACLWWNTLILVPLQVLGLTNHLTRTQIAGWSAMVAVGAYLASSIGRPWRGHAIAVGRELLNVLRLPVDAVLEPARKRSIVAPLVLVVLVMIAWTGWLCWLAPADDWDSIEYHQAMVGFAFQNHGFDRVFNYPFEHINSFPKHCELTSLWFIAFVDRRLNDLPHTLLAPAFLAAAYVLARRWSRDRTEAIGWACGLFLIPGAVLQLRSTLIDFQVSWYVLAAVHFCTRPGMRLRDALMASLCLALLIGGKPMALMWVPTLVIVALPRVLTRHVRARPWPTIGAVSCGMAMMLLSAAPIYWRNWKWYNNPIFPIALKIEALKIDFPGPVATSGVDMNEPFWTVFWKMTRPMVPGTDFADTRVFGYGHAVPMLLLPLMLVALVIALVDALSVLPAAVARKPWPLRGWAAFELLVVTVPLVFWAAKSPALWSARYNIHSAFAPMLATAWLCGRLRSLTAGENLAVFTILTNLMMHYWAEPGWGLDVQEAFHYARLSPMQRAASYRHGWSMESGVAMARERLPAGAVVVMGPDATFPAELWNERYDNRLVTLPSLGPGDFVAAAESAQATWIVSSRGEVHQLLRSRPNQWSEVGAANVRSPQTRIFQRRE